jgi:hypothetical protein
VRLREKEMEGATFRPKINPSAITSRVMSPNKTHERREALAQRVQAQREADERENLTFSPSLNPRSLALAPKGRAMANAGSPARPVPTMSHQDAGHEHETFMPAINSHSRRLAASNTRPVHERLYDDHHQHLQQQQPKGSMPASSSPGKSAGKSSPTKPSSSVQQQQQQQRTLRVNVVTYRPEMSFILKAVGSDN